MLVEVLHFSSFPDNGRCDIPVDAAFVIDSSGSISDDDYKKQREFIKSITRSLDISPSHSHAALVLFSNDAEIKARFDSYRSTKDIQRAVDQLPHVKLTTRIDLALNKANEVFDQSRAGVPKVAIVLTDGEMNDGGSVPDLKDAAKRLRERGVRVLVVGIGQNVSEVQLRYMTVSDDDIFKPADFGKLQQQLSKLVKKACGKDQFSIIFYCTSLYQSI